MAHKSCSVQRLMGKAKKNRNGAPVAQQEHTDRLKARKEGRKNNNNIHSV